MARTPLHVRKQSGGMFSVVDETITTGEIFFVDSATGTNAAGGGKNPDAPLATLDYAIGLCTASKGDMIYVMPGHSETFTAADGWDADVAGIKIIGLGWGDLRPTFNFTNTAADVAIGANNVWVENLRFVAGVSAVVRGVNVEGKTGVTFKGCDWYWGGTTTWDFVSGLRLAAGSSRCTIERCRFLAEPAVAGAARGILITGASHNVHIEACEFMGDYSTACIEGDTTLSQGLMVLDNLCYNADAGETFLEVLTGTTGVVANTRGHAGGATIAGNIVADAMAVCENFITNTAGLIAVVRGAGGTALDTD